MKSLNRTLSLVLVLAMCLGLMGIASAATFTDSTTVQYTEAVGVMTGIGAINGYADGTFKPTATITREEAAKMICYAVLGPTVAAKLSVATTGFSDVAASRWSSPFIAYCVGQGIINGLGDGTFAPTANVTGYALAKMMLAAAGYGKKGEFTGASWELNVAVMANRYGVFTGAKTADFSKAATREEAALYVFNALTLTPTVTYSKLTEEYTPVKNSALTEITNDDAYEIAESTYTKLLLDASSVNGVTGHTWFLDGTAISAFVSDATVLGTIKNGTTISSVSNAASSDYIAGLGTAGTTYTYNGGDVSAYATAKAYSKGDLVVYNNLLYVVGADITVAANTAWATVTTAEYSVVGAIVTLYAGTSTNAKKIVSVGVIKKAVEQLAAAPSVVTTGTITKVTIGAIPVQLSTNITYPSDLAKNDVILWYKAGTHYYVEKAVSVTGVITSYASGKYVVIDGTKYYPSGLGTVTSTDLEKLITAKGYTFYLDNGGNVVYVVAPSGVATVSNTVLVTATNKTTSFGTDTYQAAIAKPDGTQDAITVKKVSALAKYYANTSDAAIDPALTDVSGTSMGTPGVAGSFYSVTNASTLQAANTMVVANGVLASGFYYTYTTNADGSYNLTVAKNSLPLTAGTAIVTAGKAQFLNYGGSDLPYLATSSTIFLYYNTDKTITVKTGISNALSYKTGGVALVLLDSTGTYAQIVFLKGSTTSASAAGYDQYFVTSGSTVSLDASGNKLYTHTVVANGVIDKTVVSYTELNKGTLYFAKDYATNGAINAGAAITGVAGTTHLALTKLAYTGGILTVSGGTSASYILSGTVAIYLCNVTADGTSISQITADAAAALTYAGLDDTAVLLPTSATDPTVTAVYIYVNSATATNNFTYTSSTFTVYTNAACTTAIASGTTVAVAAGATLYVRSTDNTAGKSELTSGVVTLGTALTPAVDGTSTAIYGFTMPATALTLTATQA